MDCSCESTNCYVWCTIDDYSNVIDYIKKEINNVVWSDKKPEISGSQVMKNTKMFGIRFSHNGDPHDDDILGVILFKSSRHFKIYVRVECFEGDLFLINSVYDLDQEDIPDGVAIIYDGVLYNISEDYAKSIIAPVMMEKKRMPYSDHIQKCVYRYIKKVEQVELYHTINLTVPQQLKRYIFADPHNINRLVKNVVYDSKANFKKYDFCEIPIKFRRYNFAYLDSLKFKTPKEFACVCEDPTDSRKVRLSFSLFLAFNKLLNSGDFNNELEKLKDDKYKYLDSFKEKIDDVLVWIDVKDPPEGSFEEIGEEMAERFSDFLSETSYFDRIQSEGPINIDPDKLLYSVCHFNDDTSSPPNSLTDTNVTGSHHSLSDDLDYELSSKMSSKDDILLNKLKDSDNDINIYSSESFLNSLSAQPSESGPVTEYKDLFDL